MINPLYRILFAYALFLGAQQVSAIDSIPAPKTDVIFRYKTLYGFYGIYAYDKQNQELLGKIEYRITQGKGMGPYIYLGLLEINPAHRNQGVGGQLFRQLCRVAIRMQLSYIRWQACPFDPPHGISQPAMLKRLCKFYESLGGKVLDKKSMTDQTCSTMMERILPADEYALDAEIDTNLTVQSAAVAA